MEETTALSADYGRAVKLDKHIKIHVEMAQQSLYEVCKGLKEMRDDKLYKQLGYQNFEEYCEKEVGLKRRQAYNYISVAEHLPEDFVQSTAQIGREKLFLLAKLDEPERQEIQQKIDVDSVTVKELKSEISTLKDKQKQAESALQDKQETITSLEKQVQELENRPALVMQSTAELEEIERLKAQNEALEEQRTELEGKLFTMENEHQEQGVSDAEEKRFAEFTSNMNQQLVEERQRFKEEAQEEIQRANLQRDNAYLEVEKLKKQLDEQKKTSEEPPEMKQFRSQLGAVGICLKQLVDFLIENPDTAFLNQSETALKGALNNLDEIRKQVQA